MLSVFTFAVVNIVVEKNNRYSCFYNLHMVFSELLDVQSMAERFAAGTSRHSLSGFYLLFMA